MCGTSPEGALCRTCVEHMWDMFSLYGISVGHVLREVSVRAAAVYAHCVHKSMLEFTSLHLFPPGKAWQSQIMSL
jgi:hypothetical protein